MTPFNHRDWAILDSCLRTSGSAFQSMSYRQYIRPFLQQELIIARAFRESGDPAVEFRHLERAHILGQASTLEHVRVHWLMLMWSVRNRNGLEITGQLVRLIGAAVLTPMGWIPQGNTGGSNVSPIKPMPIPADLQTAMEEARGTSRRK